MKASTRALLADLARAGAPADLLRDVAAGDFDIDPSGLAVRWPHPVTAAAAVRAYTTLQARRPPEAAPAGRRFVDREPTDVQREALACLRRIVDEGREATLVVLAVEVGTSRQVMADVLAGLADRGLVEVWPAPRGRVAPVVVLGPRAALYPERDVRTQRSHAIEALIRRGLSVDQVIADPSITPRPTRAEVYRVRGTYCRDIPTRGEVGATYRSVVERLRAGETNQSEIARGVGVSRTRVREIIEAAKRRQELT